MYYEVYMRTNIVLDEKLVKEAFEYTDVKTKRDLINLALVEFIRHHRRKDIRQLLGKVKISDEYDHKALRKNKGK